MSWTPVSNIVPQLAKDASGTSASGYYLKFYAGGTSTPINMASASDGSGLLAKCQLNSLGYPINGSGDEFIPHIDQDYKLALYTNSTDADNDTLGSAAWVVDNISQQAVGDLSLYTKFTDLSANSGSTLMGHKSAAASSVATTVFAKLEGWLSAKSDFGATGDGVTDDTANLQSWLDAKGNLYLDEGTFITDPLLVKSDTIIYMHPNAILKENTGYSATGSVLEIGETMPSPATTGHSESNITIFGNGALIQGLGVTDSESRMGVRMNECRDVYIENLKTTRMSGDGFYIGANSAINSVLNYCDNIVLNNCIGDDNNRQGISVLDARNVWIIDFIGRNTGSTSPSTNGPWAGIDVEPDGVYSRAENINIIRPHLHDNKGCGLLIDLSPMDESQITNNIVTINVESPSCHDNEGIGCRISESVEVKSRVIVDDLDSRDNTQHGLQISNMNQPSYVEVNRPVLSNNAVSSTAGDYEFPGNTNADARQVQMLIYTNSVSDRDSFNGGLGTVQSNIRVNDPQFISTGTDTSPWRVSAYSGVSGSNNGYTIDTVINRARVWRESGFSGQGSINWNSLGGGNDVVFNDAREFNHTTSLYEEITEASTSNKTLTDSEQDKVQTNQGAVGTVRFTLPAAQGAAQNRQRFTFEVVASQSLEIIATSGDQISWSGGTEVAASAQFVSSNVVGSRMTIEKKDSTNWLATLEQGYWT